VGLAPEGIAYWPEREEAVLSGFDFSRHNKRFKTGVGIKLKGYMIGPPSQHPDTHAPYQWDFRDPALLPRDLWKRLGGSGITRAKASRSSESQASAAVLAGILRKVANAEYGKRNRLLYWGACRLVGERLSRESVRAARLCRNERGAEPLRDKQVD
jgi:hypothetical protein